MGLQDIEMFKSGRGSGGLILRLEESQFIEFQRIIRYFLVHFIVDTVNVLYYIVF